MALQFCPVTRELCKDARYCPPAKHGIIPIDPERVVRPELGGEYACVFAGAFTKTKTMMECPKNVGAQLDAPSPQEAA